MAGRTPHPGTAGRYRYFFLPLFLDLLSFLLFFAFFAMTPPPSVLV
jgi:hypothetical protein